MAKNFVVDGEVVQKDDFRVIFNIYNEDDVKRGVIGFDALARLDNGEHRDRAAIFNDYREKIASVAGKHWVANPANEVIILGLGDF
jgi:hypothetical protein